MHNPPAMATISSYVLLLSFEPCLDVHNATLPTNKYYVGKAEERLTNMWLTHIGKVSEERGEE